MKVTSPEDDLSMIEESWSVVADVLTVMPTLTCQVLLNISYHFYPFPSISRVFRPFDADLVWLLPRSQNDSEFMSWSPVITWLFPGFQASRLSGPGCSQVESSTEEHRSATSPFNDVAGGALMDEIGSDWNGDVTTYNHLTSAQFLMTWAVGE